MSCWFNRETDTSCVVGPGGVGPRLHHGQTGGAAREGEERASGAT